MDPETVSQREKELAAKPKAPELNPDEEKEALQAFRQLPPDRKQLIKRALQYPCSYCEAELKLPNTGRSHGVCKRHYYEQFKKMGITPKKEWSGNTVDIKELTDEERQLIVRLWAIVNKRWKAKGITESGPDLDRLHAQLDSGYNEWH